MRGERIRALKMRKPENIPISKENKTRGFMNRTPFPHSANQSAGSTTAVHMQHNVPKKKKSLKKKAPQIAHYKMIIAHIHVLRF